MPDRMLDGFALDQFDVLDIDPGMDAGSRCGARARVLGMCHARENVVRPHRTAQFG